jgi:hypothetical protein
MLRTLPPSRCGAIDWQPRAASATKTTALATMSPSTESTGSTPPPTVIASQQPAADENASGGAQHAKVADPAMNASVGSVGNHDIAVRSKTRRARVRDATANARSAPRLNAAIAVSDCIPQMLPRPESVPRMSP